MADVLVYLPVGTLPLSAFVYSLTVTLCMNGWKGRFLRLGSCVSVITCRAVLLFTGVFFVSPHRNGGLLSKCFSSDVAGKWLRM